MKKPMRSLGRLTVLTVLLVSLAACFSPSVKHLDQPVTDTFEQAALLNSDELTEGTKAYLEEQDLSGAYREHPAVVIEQLQGKLDTDPSLHLRFTLMELYSDEAARLTKSKPNEAVAHYLAAAELAFDQIMATVPALAPGSSAPPADVATVENVVIEVYNHSAEQVARILFDSGYSWDQSIALTVPGKTYQLTSLTEGDTLVNPGFFDEFLAADYLELQHVDIEHVKRAGFGGAMVGHRDGTPEHKKSNPFLPAMGMSRAVNATLDFTADGSVVELAFHDLALTEDTMLNGRRVPLAADLTTPLVLLFNYKADKGSISWKGMRHPTEYMDNTRLIQLEPYRTDKIPVMFIHGLLSSPKIWLAALNELNADPELNEHYQLYAFRYPTGFPLAYNAASLRERLQEFQDYYDPDGNNPNMHNILLIGHSMGGLLSSMQIRDSGDSLSKLLFTAPIDELEGVSDKQKAAFKNLFIYRASPDITRTVFMATPHRGSDDATGIRGKLGSKMIKYPIEDVYAGPLSPIEQLTEFGRQVAVELPNSIRTLEPHNPLLLTIVDQAIRQGVIFHSIMGTKDPDTPLEDSTDGTVPYWSSHLDGAASEKVYTDKHTPLAKNEGVIKEFRRIFYLHAGLPAQP